MIFRVSAQSVTRLSNTSQMRTLPSTEPLMKCFSSIGLNWTHVTVIINYKGTEKESQVLIQGKISKLLVCFNVLRTLESLSQHHIDATHWAMIPIKLSKHVIVYRYFPYHSLCVWKLQDNHHSRVSISALSYLWMKLRDTAVKPKQQKKKVSKLTGK